jgi:hypothetical protein
MSALLPKADIRERVLDVRFGPEADIRKPYTFTTVIIWNLITATE